ncbi:MAG: Rpn family recombination-promoting nuclease/putative transposase [Planctomycetaceae bacterium]|nr:Rpn family recombination-promoting nuclease/putative transposase [Planctomycetaceae bacterium]
MKAKKSEPQNTKSQGNIYDAFVKRMFGRILVIVDFLLYYADPKFVAAIDLKKIKPAPTHYIGKAGDERIVDLVFLCPLKNGQGTLMAVIIFEHQSGNLKKIPRKLHQVYLRDLGCRGERRQAPVRSVLYCASSGEKTASGGVPENGRFVAKGQRWATGR